MSTINVSNKAGRVKIRLSLSVRLKEVEERGGGSDSEVVVDGFMNS